MKSDLLYWHRIFGFGWHIPLRIFHLKIEFLDCISVTLSWNHHTSHEDISLFRPFLCLRMAAKTLLTLVCFLCPISLSVRCWGRVTGKLVDNRSVQSNPSTQPDSAHTPPGPSPALFSKCPLTAMTSPTFP